MMTNTLNVLSKTISNENQKLNELEQRKETLLSALCEVQYQIKHTKSFINSISADYARLSANTLSSQNGCELRSAVNTTSEKNSSR